MQDASQKTYLPVALSDAEISKRNVKKEKVTVASGASANIGANIATTKRQAA